MTTSGPRRLYARWVVANGLAEAAGLGTTFLLGLSAAPVLASWQGPVEVLGGAALAIVLGMVLEGAVVAASKFSRRRRLGARPDLHGGLARHELVLVDGSAPERRDDHFRFEVAGMDDRLPRRLRPLDCDGPLRLRGGRCSGR